MCGWPSLWRRPSSAPSCQECCSHKWMVRLARDCGQRDTGVGGRWGQGREGGGVRLCQSGTACLLLRQLTAPVPPPHPPTPPNLPPCPTPTTADIYDRSVLRSEASKGGVVRFTTAKPTPPPDPFFFFFVWPQGADLAPKSHCTTPPFFCTPFPRSLRHLAVRPQANICKLHCLQHHQPRGGATGGEGERL